MKLYQPSFVAGAISGFFKLAEEERLRKQKQDYKRYRITKEEQNKWFLYYEEV